MSKQISIKLIWQSFRRRKELFQTSQISGKAMEEQRKERKGLRSHSSGEIFSGHSAYCFVRVVLQAVFLLGFFFFRKSLSSSLFCHKLKQNCLTSRPSQWTTHTRAVHTWGCKSCTELCCTVLPLHRFAGHSPKKKREKERANASLPFRSPSCLLSPAVLLMSVTGYIQTQCCKI